MAEEDGDEAYFNGSDDDDEEDDNSNNDGPQPVAMDGHGGDGDIGLEQSNGGVVGGEPTSFGTKSPIRIAMCTSWQEA